MLAYDTGESFRMFVGIGVTIERLADGARIYFQTGDDSSQVLMEHDLAVAEILNGNPVIGDSAVDWIVSAFYGVLFDATV